MAQTIDRKAFFEGVKGPLFGGRFTPTQVQSIDDILDALAEFKVIEPSHVGYVFATAMWEVGKALAPVREGWAKTDAQAIKHVEALFRKGVIKRNYAVLINGVSYFGRGFVQLTWEDNYRKAEAALGIPLLAHPEMALQSRQAARILVWGMVTGAFRNKRLSDYRHGDYYKMREIINGDKARKLKLPNGKTTNVGTVIATNAGYFERAVVIVDTDKAAAYNAPSLWARGKAALKSIFS